MEDAVIIVNGLSYRLVPIVKDTSLTAEDTSSSESPEHVQEIEVEPTLSESPEPVQEIEQELEDELKTPSYYKMERDLQEIEANDLRQLKAYITIVHQDIKINNRSSLASLTDAILAKIYGQISVKQIKEITPRVRAILNHQTPNVGYLSKRFNNIRKILAARFGETSEIYRWHKANGGITFNQHVDKEKMAKLNRDNRLANITRVNEKDVREIIHKTAVSDNVFDNVLAIQLATGARMIEAIKVSEFKKVPYSENVVKVVGVAKKKKAGKDFEIDRPVFSLSADELLDLVKSTRKELGRLYDIKRMSNEEISKALNPNINRRVKELGIEGVESSHALRKLFGAITHAELPEVNRKAIDRHLHIKNVLGHERLETAGNYANFKINKSRVKINNAEDIEQKFAEVDKTDSRQAQFETVNLRGETVKIVARIPSVRGNAKIRCLDIMKQLAAAKVLITEKMLKKEFNFGSKTITALAAEKERLNAAIDLRD